MTRPWPTLSKGGANCPPLGLEFDTAGGRQMLQCWNTEGIFRLIQSIPSPKAEPFKRWLARVGYERVQEIEDPELAAKRARANSRPQRGQTRIAVSGTRGTRAEPLPSLTGTNTGGLWSAGYQTVRPLRGRVPFVCGSPGFTRCYSCSNPSGWRRCGNVAGNARRDLEKKSGCKVVTSENYLGLTQTIKMAKRIRQ